MLISEIVIFDYTAAISNTVPKAIYELQPNITGLLNREAHQ